MIVICTAWNLLGSGAVGRGSVALMVVLLAPFAVLVALAFRHPGAPLAPHPAQTGLFAGILIALSAFLAGRRAPRWPASARWCCSRLRPFRTAVNSPAR